MDSALRPRDIQARIRAGESPEDVAAAAQTNVDAIRAFADPVLAERAHVSRTAQKASVRRRPQSGGDSGAAGRTLADSAGIYFGDHSLHDDDVVWDSWRQADGRWALVASFSVEGRSRRAEFTHDLPGKYVVAENDDARLLTGELTEPGAGSGTASGHGERHEPVRRLSAVAADDLPLGDDAIELVRERAPEVEAQVAPEAEVEVEAPVGVDHVAEENEAVEDEEPALFDDHASATAPAAPSAAPPAVPPAGAAAEEATEPSAPAAKKAAARSKRKGRSAIPSWDEIMFGDSKTD